MLIGALVLLAAVSAIRNLNSPAQGTVTTQLTDNTPTPPAQKTFTDSYISFSYPYIYSVQPVQKDKQALDAVSLIASQRRDQFVSLSLARESLAGDSGVSYRKAHPELYKTVSSTPQSIIFARNDDTEYTGFIVHGDEVLSVSLSTVGTADLSKDYGQIVDSLVWRQ